MTYKIRVILDTEQDVIREIAIDMNNSLEDLHNAITNAFGFDAPGLLTKTGSLGLIVDLALVTACRFSM